MRSPWNCKLGPTRTPQPWRPWSHTIEPEAQANQAAHSFTFIFLPPGHSREGDLRYLLALAVWYKPLTWTSLTGRDRVLQTLAPSFSFMRSSQNRMFWTLSGSLVWGLWTSPLLPSISNHLYTITRRLSQYLPFPESPGLPIWFFLPGSSKEVISLLFYPIG